MASIFLRNRTWWIQTYHNGKPTQRSLRTKDRKVAIYRKNEIENQLAAGESPLANNKTALECFELFKQSRAGRITAKAQNADHYRIEKFLADENITKLRDITEEVVKRHLDARRATISNRTANHTIRGLNTFLNFCAKQNLVIKNPLKGMKKYPINIEEPRFLSVEEVKHLLSCAKSTRIYSIVALAIYTGMRWGEINRLAWEDIDLAGGMITVRKSKSKVFRKIPIHKDLAEILTEPSVIDNRTYSSFTFYWGKLLEEAKLDIRFHDLRHTFASLLIKNGVDILTVSKLLGHSTIVVTQIYSHLYQDHVRAAIDRLTI